MSNRTGRYQIYVMSSGGGAQQRITHSAGDAERAALVARREADRLPGAGRRQLRDLRRRRDRRRPAPADERAVRQHRPGLVARRQEDRVPEQAQRRRQRLRDERRRLRAEEASPSARDRGSGARRSPRPRARRRRPAGAPGPWRRRRAGEQDVARPQSRVARAWATSAGHGCTSSRRSTPQRSSPLTRATSRVPSGSSGVTSDRPEREREVAALRRAEAGRALGARRGRAPSSRSRA